MGLDRHPGVLVNSSTITGRPAAAGSVIYTELQIVLVDYFPKGLLLRLLFPRRLLTFPFILCCFYCFLPGVYLHLLLYWEQSIISALA